MTKHVYFMKDAINEAQKALKKHEVPVGAVVVLNNKIIGRGYNKPIGTDDPTAHAEIIALRKAAKKLKNYRLPNTILYVTIEPCAMCAGSLVLARVKEIIFGAKDAKAGACGSVINIAESKKLNHQIKITSGVLEEECKKIIQDFFKSKRKKQ